MTKPLSIDIRERLVSAVDGGMSRRSAAARFGVAASTAIKWVDQWRQTGHIRPRPQGGDKRSHRIEAHAVEVLGLIEETPDITLEELAGHLDEVHGLKVAPSTVWRLLDRRDMTFKKTAHASEQQRPDVVRRRQTWFEGQLDLDPERLVFIDGEPLERQWFEPNGERASTKMARRYGRSRRGERCRAPVPGLFSALDLR